MISLRDLTAGDKEKMREWRNLPEIRKYMYTDHIISPQEHELWFGRILKDPSCRYWIIVCDAEDVGVVYLYSIDRQNRRCYWGFYIVSPTVRGKGAGTFTEYSVLQHVFDEMEFNKLCCEVLAFNRGVVRMHHSFGFVQEGLFRKHISKGGEMHDVVCLAILREEWETAKKPLTEKLQTMGLVGEARGIPRE
jgi:UDP-4-amino-4,6-dideoxy-N-acetyl-beta-L-altrosamine N-acetyltransferase